MRDGKNIRLSQELTSARLTKNVLYNVASQVVPLLVAIIVLPLLIQGLGNERYGVLSLSWTILGYFSVLDMGLGGATTKYVAANIAAGDHQKLPQIVWSSLVTLLFYGLVLGFLVAFTADWIVNDALKIPAELIAETRQVLFVLALSLPFIIATASVRGVLEAHQEFGRVNAVRLPGSILLYLAPLTLLPFTNSLPVIIFALLATRIMVFGAYLLFCWRLIPALRAPQFLTMKGMIELVKYGGWLTVSNIIGPLMAYMDRFIVGMQIGMSAVAYYATTYDIVTKLWIVSGSLLSVLFPVFSSYSSGDTDRLTGLFARAVKFISFILTPLVIILVLFGQKFLQVWIGRDFASNSATVLQLLALGVLICAVAQVPYNALQAMGYPQLIAKIQMIELPIYLGMLWYTASQYGIVGMAIAWLARIIVDAIILFWFYYRIVKTPVDIMKNTIVPTVSGVAITVLLLYVSTSLTTTTYSRIILCGISLFLFTNYAWRTLRDAERQDVMRLINWCFGRV